MYTEALSIKYTLQLYHNGYISLSQNEVISLELRLNELVRNES